MSSRIVYFSGWSYTITIVHPVISLSLNVFLTFMIVIRLVMHSRNIRRAMGTSCEASGLYSSIINMLIESCALYASSYLLLIVTWCLNADVWWTFQPILGETQVRAALMHNLSAVG